MFKHRVITAIALGAIGYFLITMASLEIFMIAGVFSALVMASEWARVAQLNTVFQKAIFLLLLSLGVVFLNDTSFQLFSVIVLAGWAFALYWVIRYQQGHSFWPRLAFSKMLMGVFLFAPLYVSVYALKISDMQQNRHALLFVVILIILADVMAYLVGKALGSHPLISRVSPKKTWEGTLGGIGASVILAVPIAYWCGVTNAVDPWIILPAFIIASVSVLGDLTESVCKRHAKIKDSGQIFPGHGGMMDRFDSYTSGLPFAYILLHIF